MGTEILIVAVTVAFFGLCALFVRICDRIEAVSFDLLLTVASAIGLTVYLFYVLARPERF